MKSCSSTVHFREGKMPREHKTKGRRSVPILVHRIWKKIAEEMDVKEKGKKSTPRQTMKWRIINNPSPLP